MEYWQARISNLHRERMGNITEEMIEKNKNKNKNMVFCKNCSWYYATECKVLEKYVPRSIFNDKDRIQDGFISQSNGIKMCHHPCCFCIKTVVDIVLGEIKVPERDNGQAQFNVDCNCSRYKPTRLHRFIRMFTKEKRK